MYGRDIEPGGGLSERLTAAIAKLNPQLPALRLVKVGVCVRLRVRMGCACSGGSCSPEADFGDGS